MKIERHISPLLLLAQMIFVALPTITITYFLLWNFTQYFSFISAKHTEHAIYFSVGIFSAMLFYAFRFRFITTTPLLFFVMYVIYKSMDKYGANWGEFDVFFISIQFMLFCLLFSIGWIFGWAFQRVSFFHFLISGLFLLISIFVISKNTDFTYYGLAQLFVPIILYAVYIIFIVESLKNVDVTNSKFWTSFGLRLFGFLTSFLLIIGVTMYAFKGEINAKLEQTRGIGNGSLNATSQKDKNGDTQMNDAMNIGAKNSKSNELLFVAHIDNFFDGTNIPNPLYLTSYHYTHFDTLSETFERDSLMPFNDEFLPEIAKMPLFSIKTDSMKVLNTKSTKQRRSLEVEIFNKKLNNNTFLAPSTAFSVQKITVDKNFQKEFKNAYRTKSNISKLNSAYFIYNSPDPFLKLFQEQRFNELRKVKSYTQVDTAFMKYYTSFPASNTKYLQIKKLGDSLAKAADLPIDKVLAVRDYFLQRNILGEQVYKYSDNPGIPGMPSASKLCYFLFESHKGYCAYYSGATLFLLRAMGIPCRITVGFLTEDRASKNKGWYWYYANQSHAWVEVYFPEYGWIDFDTTVGNDEAREATQSDATPPTMPLKAPLALNAKVLNIDTLKKLVTVKIGNITLKDKVYDAHESQYVFDVRNANYFKDTIQLQLGNLKKGDDIIAVCYDNKLFNINETEFTKISAKLNKPLKIDDVFIQDMQALNKQLDEQKASKDPLSTQEILVRLALLLLGVLLLFFAIPFVVHTWYKYKANRQSSKQKAFDMYNYLNLRLHQFGFEKKDETPLQYANRLDGQLNINYSKFMNIYLKTKYSNQALSKVDLYDMEKVFLNFKNNINKNIPANIRAKKMLQPLTTIEYLFKESKWNK